MKKCYRILFALLSCFAPLAAAHAQLINWSGKTPVTVVNTGAAALNGYQELLLLNTQAYVTAGDMEASGNDIRFADSCGTILYDYWIESGMNTDSTFIWLRLPSIAAGDSAGLFMYYGNPGAIAGSSFAAVFPLAYISSGNTAMGSTQTFDWFELLAGDTLFLGANSPLTINSRVFINHGVISGNGAGEFSSATNQAGNGPGAGTSSGDSGSGGGSYGGIGGTGGMDAGDAPGTGGAIYGTAFGPDIQMGSSGGSGTTFGGAGGGALTVNAGDVIFTGVITMNGSDGLPTASRGGGGGSGGGVKIEARNLSSSGTISVRGGNGGQGASSFNDGGGGGGGGRIKLFYENLLLNSGIHILDGGTGGGFGDVASGQPGGPGQDSLIVAPFFISTMVTIGVPMVNPLVLELVLSEADTTICEHDSLTVTAAPGFSSYSFMLNGTLVATGVLSHTFGGINDGDSISVEANFGSCSSETSTFAVQVNISPVVSITGPGSACINDGIISLGASPVGGTFSGAGVTGSTFDPQAAGIGTHELVYSYSDQNGCGSTDTLLLEVLGCAGIGTLTEASMQVFPNPSNGAFSVIAGQDAMLSIVNGLGEEVQALQVKANAPHHIVINGGPGIYFIRNLSAAQGRVTKIVIAE